MARAEQKWHGQSKYGQNKADQSRIETSRAEQVIADQTCSEKSRKGQRATEQTRKKTEQNSYLDLFTEGSCYNDILHNISTCLLE